MSSDERASMNRDAKAAHRPLRTSSSAEDSAHGSRRFRPRARHRHQRVVLRGAARRGARGGRSAAEPFAVIASAAGLPLNHRVQTMRRVAADTAIVAALRTPDRPSTASVRARHVTAADRRQPVPGASASGHVPDARSDRSRWSSRSSSRASVRKSSASSAATRSSVGSLRSTNGRTRILDHRAGRRSRQVGSRLPGARTHRREQPRGAQVGECG